ncbi:MAG: divergent polysaccharide deacetylase family protein [Spirochaetales bacterium]|nr:divergent polysaccharide deacetylase family protein [Spirochaetales bacterium]
MKKKSINQARKNPKQKAFYSLLGLFMILILAIVLVVLIPVKKEKDLVVTSKTTENNKIIDKKEEQKPHFPKNRDKKRETIEDRRQIALVIDDAGNNIEDLLPFLQFPGKLTIAVLPQLPYSREAATLIKESGKEVLLHLPMEAESGINPGPGALFVTDTTEEIIRKLQENLSTVPGAIGVNNHMGSKFTANPEKMEILFRYFSQHKLYFLDSRTTNRSVSGELAAAAGIPFLRRNIFIDNIPVKESIRNQMEKGIALAKKMKYVILIGHVQNSEVLDVLYEILPEMEQNNYSFVGLSEIL